MSLSRIPVIHSRISILRMYSCRCTFQKYSYDYLQEKLSETPLGVLSGYDKFSSEFCQRKNKSRRIFQIDFSKSFSKDFRMNFFEKKSGTPPEILSRMATKVRACIPLCFSLNISVGIPSFILSKFPSWVFLKNSRGSLIKTSQNVLQGMFPNASPGFFFSKIKHNFRRFVFTKILSKVLLQS